MKRGLEFAKGVVRWVERESDDHRWPRRRRVEEGQRDAGEAVASHGFGRLATLVAVAAIPVGGFSFALAQLAAASSQPTVTAVAPAAGPLAGGNLVTVSGSGFTGTVIVQFGTTPGTNVAADPNGDSLTVSAPPGVAGTVDVTVTTTGGISATSSADRYTYDAPPAVTGVSPSAGPAAGGNTVTVSGANLAGAVVDFGSTAATNVSVNSGGTSLTATAPVEATGTVDVTVTTPGGTSATSSADRYTFVPAPTVTTVSPVAGLPSGGTTVTVTGTNFTGATVAFGSTAATNVSVNSGGTSLTATAPAEAAGTVDVTVTTTGGTSAVSPADRYTYETAPTVTSIQPGAGPLSGGGTVTLTGTNFIGASVVDFGSQPGTNVSVGASGTTLTVTAPAEAAGTVDVTVTTPVGTSSTSPADQYVYQPPPTVSAVAPTAGPAVGGNTVTVSGTNFTRVASVDFGSTPATNVSVNPNGTSLTITAPAEPAGTVDVTVTTPGGTSATSSGDPYTYVPAPTVSSVSPNTGSQYGGTTVTVTGTNLSGASAVDFESAPATNVTVNGAGTQLTAVSPAGAAGSVDVTVTTVGGTSVTSSADRFTYGPPPTVSGFSPTAGPLGGGTTVVVSGTALSAVTEVDFGNSAATISSVAADGTSMTVATPAGSGITSVTVRSPYGTATAPGGFLYWQNDTTVNIPVAAVTTLATVSNDTFGGMAVAGGNAYVSSWSGTCNGSISQVNLATGAVTTLATPNLGPEGDLATDGHYLYVVANGGCYSVETIDRVSIATGATSTIPITFPANVYPTGLTVGPGGQLYMALSNGEVGAVDVNTGQLTQLYSYGTISCNGSNVLQVPSHLTADATSLWVLSDGCYQNTRAYELDQIALAGGTMTTVVPAGAGAGNAELVSAGDYLYDAGPGATVVRIAKSSGTVTYIAGVYGSATLSASPTDGTGTDAWFAGIKGLGSDGTHIFTADGGSSRIRQLQPGTPLPSAEPPQFTETLNIPVANVSTLALVNKQNLGSLYGMVVVGSHAYFASGSYDPIVGEDHGNFLDVNLATGAASGLITTTQYQFRDVATNGYYLYVMSYGTNCCGVPPSTAVDRVSLATGAASTIPISVPANAYLTGMTVGPAGQLYVSLSNGEIAAADVNSGQLTQLYSYGAISCNGSNVLQVPSHLTADATSLWVLSDGCYQNTRAYELDQIALADGAMTTVVPAGAGAANAELVSAGDYLYDAGPGATVIRIAKSTGAFASIAGSTTQGGYVDGFGPDALFGGISALDSNGTNVFVFDAGNGAIRDLAPAPPPSAAGGPLGYQEMRGGSNPAELSYCQQCAGDPVDTATGALTEQSTDVKLPGRGVPLDLSRTYDSEASDVLGPFGYGWSGSYGMSISADPYYASVMDVTQENGSRVAFTQNAQGQWVPPSRVLASLVHNGDGSWTFTRKMKEIFTFNSSGKLSSVRDLNGETTTLSYNTSNQLTTVTDAAGRTLTFAYSGSLVTSATDPMGNATRYGYDSNNELTSVTDPTGAVTNYGYGTDHELTSITDPRRGVTTNSYDTSRRVTAQVDPMGRHTTFAYTLDNTDSGTVTMTDPTSSVTTYQYSTGELQTKTIASGTGVARTWTYSYDPVTLGPSSVTAPGSRTTTATFDANGNLLTQTDPLGRKTTNTYDGLDDLTSSTDPAGVTTTYSYDASGNLLSVSTPLAGTNQVRTTTYTHGTAAHPGDVTAVTDPDGHTTTLSYDAYGNRSSVTDPLVHTTSTTYDTDGHPLTTTDALGKVTARTYDKRGALLTVQDPDGNLTTYTYDADGNKTSVTDANGHKTTYTYDADNELTGTTDANNHTTTATYDGDGRPLSSTDANNHTTTRTYDAAGELVSSALPTGATTTYTYDSAGERVSSTDPNGNTSTFAYDAGGELTGQTDASGGTTSYTYDSDGRKTSSTDPNGHATTYAYDSLGRLTSTTDPLNRTTSYTYDLAGNELTSTDPAGRVTTRTFDAGNELTGTSYSDGTTPGVSFTYDADGRRATMSDGTGTTTYTYDAAGRPLSVTNGAGSAVGYGYDAAGNITSVGYPSGQKASYAYDPADQLTSVTDWLGNAVSYGHDTAGNVTSITYPNGITTAITLDAANQATSIAASAGNSSIASFSYVRDNAGLVTSETDNGASQPNQSYTYTAAERLASANGQTYSYDAAGQLTATPGGTTLTYNTGGELTSTTTGSGSTTFAYDALGNRTSATPPTGSTSTYGYNQAGELTASTTPQANGTYAYNGDGLRMSDSFSGSVSNQFTWDTLGNVPHLLTDGTNAYLYGVGDTPIEQISLTTSTPTFVISDALGSVRELTDGSGAVVDTQSYDSFGNQGATAGTVTTPFGFGGAYTDPTGLEYLVHRYYDPATGQFLSVDPAVSITAQPYGYAAGDPVNRVDPLGLIVDGEGGGEDGFVIGPDLAALDSSEALTAGQAGAASAQSEYVAAEIQRESSGGPAPFDPFPTNGESPCAEKLQLSGSVTRQAGEYLEDGRLNRPYLKSSLMIQNIISEGNVRADPGGAPDSVQYTAPGSFRGVQGTWEIVINVRTSTIYHFVFKRD